MGWDRLQHVKLENDFVLLHPIRPTDADQLHEIAFDPDIWRYFTVRVTTEHEFRQFMSDATSDTQAGRRIVFCVVSKAVNRIVGSMAYGNLAEKEKRLEIGWSWLGKDYRGTGLNRWAKYLLLKHAFEVLQCERVEFKTDVLNIQARKGLRNIGAIEEGVLRSFNYMPGGRRRDAIYYSILRSEWTTVKELLDRLPTATRPSPVAQPRGATAR